MESSLYSSVRGHIIAKALDDEYVDSALEIVEQLEKMRELVELHRPKTYKTCFTSEERKWLVELLCWESLFPDAKSKFPGKRPSNPAKELTPPNGYVPQCDQCMKEGSVKEDKCPYIRMVSCSRPEHPDYKTRLDMEHGSEPTCPACHNERMPELKAGWVFA